MEEDTQIEQIDAFFKEYIFGFIYHDLEAAIKGRANYLAALGLVAYTEFLGGLVLGNLGQQGFSKKRFYAFFDRLGPAYVAIRQQRKVVKVYSNIRSGLAHAYFIDQESVVKMNARSGHGKECGIEYDPETEKVWFIVGAYWRDFKKAVKSYHRELTVARKPHSIECFLKAVGRHWHYQGLGPAKDTS